MIEMINFKKSVGEFVPEGSSNSISYDNRIICCITDEDKSQQGISYFEQKIKTQHLAECFGVSVASVDDMLSSFVEKNIEFIFSVVSGKLVFTGINCF